MILFSFAHLVKFAYKRRLSTSLNIFILHEVYVALVHRSNIFDLVFVFETARFVSLVKHAAPFEELS